jgi:hypothetical protein
MTKQWAKTLVQISKMPPLSIPTIRDVNLLAGYIKVKSLMV